MGDLVNITLRVYEGVQFHSADLVGLRTYRGAHFEGSPEMKDQRTLDKKMKKLRHKFKRKASKQKKLRGKGK